MDFVIQALRGMVKFLLVWLLWDLVLFNLGRGVLLLLTWGRYPRDAALERDTNRIALAGLLVLVGMWSAVAIHNNLAPAQDASSDRQLR